MNIKGGKKRQKKMKEMRNPKMPEGFLDERSELDNMDDLLMKAI